MSYFVYATHSCAADFLLMSLVKFQKKTCLSRLFKNHYVILIQYNAIKTETQQIKIAMSILSLPIAKGKRIIIIW